MVGPGPRGFMSARGVAARRFSIRGVSVGGLPVSCRENSLSTHRVTRVLGCSESAGRGGVYIDRGSGLSR